MTDQTHDRKRGLLNVWYMALGFAMGFAAGLNAAAWQISRILQP